MPFSLLFFVFQGNGIVTPRGQATDREEGCHGGGVYSVRDLACSQDIQEW